MLRQVIGFGTHATSFASVILIVIVATVTAQQNASSAPSCEPTGSLIKVADLPEGSGVAVSRRIPGRVWAHNDSGEPALVALDSEGTVVGSSSHIWPEGRGLGGGGGRAVPSRH